jgi:hypothetical protein
VLGGRLVLDEPIDLPEGSEVDLVPGLPPAGPELRRRPPIPLRLGQVSSSPRRWRSPTT